MPKILVVDDDPDILNLVAARLRKAGHQVITANSGTEALKIVNEKGKPDLAVLDVAMPGMTGIELLQHFRSLEGMSDLPTVFLSAKVQPEDIEAGRALGAMYLTKPFVASALLKAVERSVAKPEILDSW